MDAGFFGNRFLGVTFDSKGIWRFGFNKYSLWVGQSAIHLTPLAL